ncbi:hypothetical protein QTJ16_002697 [Diplocarpon rosae]|uniref:Uncharacterized protein n=1 Tax=Diplocarpon rosae TaxID=946125 RepID=A0AAD9WG72_9HELO|nr:hypothetical protein QTJ16_002697 [Diplocarpon rosae]PBP17876.1 hypothetical protein BUE80_DR011449 [Diplocarpon rosae]
MFCTSLRHRPEWATVPNTLLSSRTLRWAEQTLSTHDFTIPLPKSRQQDALESFLLLALSPSDLIPESGANPAMPRIQRLYHHTGGMNVGILFLLNEKLPKGNGSVALMSLQATLPQTFCMPIIPLASLASLQTSLAAFQKQLVKKRRSQTSAEMALSPVTSLLPYATNNPPLPEHARNVLSDICRNISDIARVATTREGQQLLREYLEDKHPGAVRDIIDFWVQEIFVD